MFCSNQVPGIRLVPVWLVAELPSAIPAQRTWQSYTLDLDMVLIFTLQGTAVSRADTAKTHRLAVADPIPVSSLLYLMFC